MTIAHTRANQELEDDGEDELTVAALRYTGPQSVFNANSLRQQGYFPSQGVLQGGNGEPGPWVVALIPSRRLGFYENHQDLEIAYDKETIAEAFLEKNTLPSPVFGPNENPSIRDRVLDKLEIERLPRRAEAIREDLAEIAGEDADPGEEAEAEEFPYDLTRSELWAASKPFDPPYDWNGMQVTDAEDFLMEQDDSQLRSVVQQVQNGEDPTLEGEETDTDEADEGGEN